MVGGLALVLVMALIMALIMALATAMTRYFDAKYPDMDFLSSQ